MNGRVILCKKYLRETKAKKYALLKVSWSFLKDLSAIFAPNGENLHLQQSWINDFLKKKNPHRKEAKDTLEKAWNINHIRTELEIKPAL